MDIMGIMEAATIMEVITTMEALKMADMITVIKVHPLGMIIILKDTPQYHQGIKNPTDIGLQKEEYGIQTEGILSLDEFYFHSLHFVTCLLKSL